MVWSASLSKSFAKLSASLQSFARPFFFTDAHGIVMLSNRNGSLGQPLWPVASHATLAQQFGAPNAPTLLAREITDSAWTMFDGRRGYVLRAGVP
ncbi:hypothetical protein [Rhodopseudomonas palustris]|uniref:hypothetical protein n=1 Tax=Rhodopseudomonas palustris TaxID=1076 RepID=UPI000673F908